MKRLPYPPLYLYLLPLLWLLPHAAAADGDLAAQIAAAAPGDTIVVQGGSFAGPLLIDKPLTLQGQNWPIIDGGGRGTVVNITAPNVTLSGFVIRGSGDSLDEENSGITVEGESADLSNNQLENTLFGIYLQNSHNSRIANNTIRSLPLDVPRRGDSIRVWYSNDVVIEGNTVEAGRDVVLWYSERLTIRDNSVSNGRYGLHFMYCDDAKVSGNLLYHNSVGAFMMYSRRITLDHNTIASNRGPSGYGIGLKDMDDAAVHDNLFLDNRIGIYLDNSPREVDSIGRIEGNTISYNDIGLSLMPSVRHNRFVGNSFVENHEHVMMAGGGRMQENWWSADGRGNYWSDYAGFDANGDGLGDIPYRSDRLFEDMLMTYPALRLFAYSPAANAIDFAAKAFPLVRPQPKLVDDFPLMRPMVPAGVPIPPQPARLPVVGWLLLGLAAVLAGAAVWHSSQRKTQRRARWQPREVVR